MRAQPLYFCEIATQIGAIHRVHNVNLGCILNEGFSVRAEGLKWGSVKINKFNFYLGIKNHYIENIYDNHRKSKK